METKSHNRNCKQSTESSQQFTVKCFGALLGFCTMNASTPTVMARVRIRVRVNDRVRLCECVMQCGMKTEETTFQLVTYELLLVNK